MDGSSVKTGEIPSLMTTDYVLFSLLFFVSLAIGFYHAYVDRNKTTEEDFQFAGRRLHPIPVSMSLAATYFSALNILGGSAEVYTHGTMAFWMIGGSFIATIFVAHVFIPKFYELKVTSCFEYIELRFCKELRLLTSVMFILRMLIVSALMLYVPCLALETVTDTSLMTGMAVTAAVCTIYTMLGGMKSVVWIDSLQLVVILAGMLALIVNGSYATGGFAKAWQIANTNQRIEFGDASIDPRTRHSIWSLTIGFSIVLIYSYGLNQVEVQRACSMSSAKKAALAVWLQFPVFVLIISLVCLTGVVLYAFYSECHPVTFGLIKRNDQLVPLFALDVLTVMPGLMGLFLASVFSGSLSTISSILTGMSTVVLKDFIKQHCCINLADRRGIAVSRMAICTLGCLMFLSAVVISNMKGLILQLGYTLVGITTGPIMGLFISGMFFPCTNTKGASIGLLVSFVIMLWLCLGGMIEKPSWTVPLPVHTTGCNWNVTSLQMANLTTPEPNASPTTPTTEPLVYNFYRMSYLWFAGFGLLVNIIATLIASFVTGFTRPSTVDPKLIIPIFDVLCPWLPERIRRPLRFGVNYEQRSDSKPYEDVKERQQTTRLME